MVRSCITFAGTRVDQLVANAGTPGFDILIGGTTDYDGNPDVLNGFAYDYLVTSVTEVPGHSGGRAGTERYETPLVSSFDRVVTPHAAASTDPSRVWVVPNPFRASAAWDLPAVRSDPLTRHIAFMGLPRARSTIKIWTVAGDLVQQLEHDGSGGDGEQAWNLVSRNGQDIESGVYLFTVDSSLGHRVGRFVVVR